MGFAHDAMKAVGQALHEVHAGAEKLAWHKVTGAGTKSMLVTSPEFTGGARLPISCTADGSGLPPAIEWANLPLGAQSLVVIAEDPDAPFPEPYVHWMVYGIPGSALSLDVRSRAAFMEGLNSKLAPGYAPASPPPAHGVHHYHFQVFALDKMLDLEQGIGRRGLLDEMQGHVLAWGEIVGVYERT